MSLVGPILIMGHDRGRQFAPSSTTLIVGAVLQYLIPLSSTATTGPPICSHQKGTTCTPILGDKPTLIQTSTTEKNDACLNVAYPRDRNSNADLADLIQIKIFKGTPCITLYNKKDCKGANVLLPHTTFPLLLYVVEDNILETFGIHGKSIKPSFCAKDPPNNAVLPPGLKLTLAIDGTSSELVVPGKDTCFSLDFDHSLNFHYVNLNLGNSGTKTLPQSCIELFIEAQCEKPSVQIFTQELSPGGDIPIWRLPGKASQESNKVRWSKISNDAPSTLIFKSARLCPSVKYSEMDNHPAGVSVAVIVKDESLNSMAFYGTSSAVNAIPTSFIHISVYFSVIMMFVCPLT